MATQDHDLLTQQTGLKSSKVQKCETTWEGWAESIWAWERESAPTGRVQSHFTKRTLWDFRCVWLGSNKTLRESDSHMETHHTDTRRCLATLPAPLFRNPAATPCARCATCPHTGAKTCANCCQSFHIPHLYSRDTHTQTGRSCWQRTEQHSPSWISTTDSAGWEICLRIEIWIH